MLLLHRKPITDEQIGQLKAWSLAGPGMLLRELIQGEVAALQVEAVLAESEEPDCPNRALDRKHALAQAAELKCFLDVLNRYTKNPTELAYIEIQVAPLNLD